MTIDSEDPIELAKTLAPEVEEILGVTNLATSIDSLQDSPPQADVEMRDVSPGDIASIAGLIVGLVALFQQIKAGNTFQGASREKILERMVLHLSEARDLPAEAKERLITLLIDRILPPPS